MKSHCIVWLDSAYPQAWNALPHSTYDEWFQKGCFGTSDFWDVALRKVGIGQRSFTLIENMENDIIKKALEYEPDVICSQNVGLWQPSHLRAYGFKGKCVGFCSYKADGDHLRDWDILFSSFHWLVDGLKEQGINAQYMPLAFGRPVLERVPQPKERDLPLTFVGGLGIKIWNRGTWMMDVVAKAFPDTFKWWGYKVGKLTEALERAYQGEAWGRDYFSILARSQIVINRHGEIARGQGRQNMREFEVGGMGAYLLSDTTQDEFGISHYKSSEQLLDLIDKLLNKPSYIEEDAKHRQECTLRQDCYENRVPYFIETIDSL